MIPEIKDVQPWTMTIACIGQIIKRGLVKNPGPEGGGQKAEDGGQKTTDFAIKADPC